MGLTKKQKDILDFITQHKKSEGIAPTYAEIQNHFGLKSKGSVYDYVRYLKSGGHLKEDSSSARSLDLAPQAESNVALPILGKVAAGHPLEIVDQDNPDTISVPESMINRGEHYALEVSGESMIDDGILDGDVIVVKSQKTAKNGDTVVAVLDGAATVKRFFRKQKLIELHPANQNMKPIPVKGGDFKIQGIVVGLFRHY